VEARTNLLLATQPQALAFQQFRNNVGISFVFSDVIEGSAIDARNYSPYAFAADAWRFRAGVR
jgi:hypothetical protein